MLRKTMIIGGVCLLTATLWFTFNQKSVKISTVENSSSTEKFTKNPNWYKDYIQLKGLDKIEVPYDLQYRWYKHDQYNARYRQKGLKSLENIQEIGPDHVGGRTRSVVIDHSNQNHIVTGGVSGGLFYSNDNGVTWNITDDQALTLSVTAITQSPFDADVFYYGSGETYNNTLNVNGQGLFVSKDGGASTQHLENSQTESLTQIWDVEHSKVFDSTIYIGTQNDGLWMSDDAGESYTKIYSTSGTIHEVHAFNDTTIMFSVAGSGIFRLDEISHSATKKSNGLPTSNISRISFDYCDAQPDIIYAQILDNTFRALSGTYKTTDGGEAWSAVNDPQTVNYSQGWYDFKFAVSPTDPDFVLSGGVYSAYSRNGGLSWTELPYSHADQHEFTFYANGTQFINGNDGGVYRYNVNNINSVSDLNRGYNVTQFYAGYFHPTSDAIVAGSQDNNTRYTVDGSGTFYNILGGDGAFCAIHQQDPNVMYLSSQYLNLRRREGNDYTNIRNYIYQEIGGQDNTWFINPFEINPLDGDQLYVPTRREVFRSLDKGNSWIKLTANLPGDTYAVGLSWDEDPIAYIGGTGSVLYRLNNAATTDNAEVPLFTLAPIDFRGSTIGCIEVDPNDRGTIYVALSNISTRGRIWKITDADTDNPTWHNLHSNLPEYLAVSWIEVDPDNPNFLIAATDYGLYTSTTGGGWWEKENRIPNVAIDQVRLRHSDRKLYIFTHGRGAWTADLAQSPTASVEPTAKTSNLSIYPNPAQNTVHINTTEVSAYRVYDRSGRTVIEGKGNTVDVRELRNGVYFLEANTAESRLVEKLIISRD
jgi:photosystem II stability/assembly factor-like uncharacterized protein